MQNLPTGTVTFLFTDIEGSTRLLHALGPEQYAEALAQHRRILREDFTAHAVVEVDTPGDAFFVGFPTATGAVAGAALVLRVDGPAFARTRTAGSLLSLAEAAAPEAAQTEP